MIFLISLVPALILAIGLGRPLRRCPLPFYLAAAAAAAFCAGAAWTGLLFPAWFKAWVWPVLGGGGLAGALFVLVMITGALPNGSAAMKRLMPVRGQLSVMAGILALGHGAVYAKDYFRILTGRVSRASLAGYTAAAAAFALILVMLPLFLTSFRKIRKKMKASEWKRLQRWAYLFYGLLYLHVMLVTVPGALRGKEGSLLKVFVYSAVFLGYLACRLLKARAVRDQRMAVLPGQQAAAAAAAAFLSVLAVLSLVLAGDAKLPGGRASAEERLEAAEERLEAALVPVARAAESVPGEITVEGENAAEGELSAAEEKTTAGDAGEKTAAGENASAGENAAEGDYAGSRAKVPGPSEESAQYPGERETDPAGGRVYRDGVWAGAGTGNHGSKNDIEVLVRIENDRILSVEITAFRDDEMYFSPEIEGAEMTGAMLEAQKPYVDTVSGATYSSEGLIQAVADALSKARR